MVIGCNKNIACANSAIHAVFLLHTLVGLKGPQRAQGARTRPKAARASVAIPLYLKLLTRQTIKPGTRQAKMPQIRQTNSHD